MYTEVDNQAMYLKIGRLSVNTRQAFKLLTNHR